MTRWRLVTVQNGKEHVSTVVSAPEEVDRDLAAEADLHRMAGWKVLRVLMNDQLIVIATKGRVSRRVFFREYDPMEDI